METPLCRATGKDQSANAEINFGCPRSSRKRLLCNSVRPASPCGLRSRALGQDRAPRANVPGPYLTKYSASVSRPKKFGVEN